MLMIRRSPYTPDKRSIKIYENGRYICAVEIMESGSKGQVHVGCIGDPNVTFLRGEIPFNPDLNKG